MSKHTEDMKRPGKVGQRLSTYNGNRYDRKRMAEFVPAADVNKLYRKWKRGHE